MQVTFDMTEQTTDNQILQFHQQIVDLIKKYQFRDRNQICCFGISVSQCYVLEALHTHGPLTMNELAKKMYLKISTMTRVVEQLVKKGYVRREEGLNDRRVRLINLTKEGKAIYKKAWENIFESEKVILKSIPSEHKAVLIDVLRKLNQAVSSWQSCCEIPVRKS